MRAWGVRAAFKATSVSAELGQRANRVVATVKRVAGRACSFVPGTLGRMSDGSLTPIEDLQVVDMVLAGDPETGQTSAEVVITPLTSTGDKHLVALRFDGDVEAVVATDNHPYWVRDAEWVAAGELVVGDTTLASDGAVRTLVHTTDLGWFQDQTVHNLHVAGEHTYYVTADPAQADQLVHNTGPSCPVNQMNAAFQRGKAPRGIIRIDRGKVKGEQIRAYIKTPRRPAALNIDGTWKHGRAIVTRAQRIWLKSFGWRLP